MAAVAPSTDQAAELLQKLSLESQPKAVEIPEPTKKISADSANGQIQSYDRSLTPLLTDYMDPTMYYLPNGYPSPAYYYGGYDGTGNELEDYSRYMNAEGGVDMSTGVYGDKGSVMYHHGYSYAPYGPYSPAASPVPTMGQENQLYGAQHYQYPTPYFQSMAQTSGGNRTPTAPAKGEISTSAAADQAPFSVDSANAKSGVKGNTGSAAPYQNPSLGVNSSYGRGAGAGFQDPRFGYDGFHSPIPWLDVPYFADPLPRPVNGSSMTSSVSNGNAYPSSRNQNYRPHLMGLHHPRPLTGTNAATGYMNRMYPNKSYGRYGNTYRSGLGYGSGYDTRSNSRGWMAFDGKYKPRGRGNGFYGYGTDSIDGLNELNRGPRSKSSKTQKPQFTPTAVAVKGQNIPLDTEKEKSSTIPVPVPDREQYNREDFPVTYADAKFFIIKSYSEDDVHKSIKYSVWASTPNGNKKLDAAYQEAQQKSEACPIFLFFSVNTSGQFVGVAEMVGPVDFNKNVEYWQQDKWIGCFPVKWHIVKDLPNSLLKHIILENNENKPVTNSRDTQEVKLDQGLQVLKIFKDHASKQCILDDFDFYEDRQKKIQDKKAKQQQFLKQTQLWEGKLTEEKNKENKEGVNGDAKSQQEAASDMNKEVTVAVQANGDSKLSENGSLPKSGELPKSAKPVAAQEKKVVANGVTNGC